MSSHHPALEELERLIVASVRQADADTLRRLSAFTWRWHELAQHEQRKRRRSGPVDPTMWRDDHTAMS